MLRKTTTSVVAASAVLLSPAEVVGAPAPELVVQAVADSAADVYRDERRRVLQRYRARTAAARQALAEALGRAGTSRERDEAWERYKRATESASARGEREMRRARERFRATVAQARAAAR